MKVALFFGTFNPVHHGHLIIAETALNETETDQVWLVVSPQNPFKKRSNLLNEYDRYRICELAVGEHPRLRASNVEFALPKPSYTIDTLTHLAERYRSYCFSILMGADNLSALHKWKNYEAILRHYPIFAYPRPGEVPPETPYANTTIIEGPLLHISATRIRQLLAEGKSARYLTPQPALDYITEKALYAPRR